MQVNRIWLQILAGYKRIESMVIAINTLFFVKENELDFLKKVFKTIISAHPEHTFIIISDKDNAWEESSNLIHVNIGETPSGISRWTFSIYFRIKNVLKKYRPDVFINNGEAMLHFKEVPQIVFNPDLKYIQDPASFPNGVRRMNEIFSNRFYQKVQSLILLSDFENNYLEKFKIPKDKIHILQYGPDIEIVPVAYEERETVKDKYAKGFEYFLYSGFITTSKNLVNLLKAFSAFKKRQRSNMQLLITGREGTMFHDFKKMIELYKYKNDVHILKDLPETENEKIIASAYALIFPDQLDKSVNTLLTAIRYEVPAVVAKTGSLSEAGRDAVIHYEMENIPDLAGKMMLLFKDEKFRKTLVENSKNWVGSKDFQCCTDETWEIIERVANKKI